MAKSFESLSADLEARLAQRRQGWIRSDKSWHLFYLLTTPKDWKWEVWDSRILHWYQRARYGISFMDEWSLSQHIIEVAIRTLHKYKSAETPYMNPFPDGQPHYDLMTGEDTTQRLTDAEWDAIIDKIIHGFRTYMYIEPEPYDGGAAYEEAKELFFRFFDHFDK